MSSQAASRASAASTSPTRARTSSDLTAGTVTSSVLARSAYDMPSISRISSADRCCSGSRPDVLDQAREVVAALRLLDRVAQRLARQVEDVGRRRHRPAQVVDAAVVGDAVQPRPQVHLPRVGPQRAVRADEHVLEEILGVLARPGPQHLAHVREQALAVAVVDDAEGLVAAGAEEREQLLVRAQAEQRHPERPEAGTGRRAHC